MLQVFRVLLRAARRGGRHQVVHAHGSTAIIVCAAARVLFRRQLRGVLLLFTFHGWVENTWKQRLIARAEILLARQAAMVIVCSPAQADRLTCLPRWTVHYIPNGVRVKDFARDRALARRRLRELLGLPENARIVVNIGRLVREKRQDVFLRAARRILAEVGETYFMLVGAGPDRDRLELLPVRRELGSRVRFLGLVDDVATITCAADVLLHTADVEASPRVIAEAMASRTAVVATRVGGVPWQVRDGLDGFLVPRADDAAAAARVIDLLTDDLLYQAIVAQAFDRVHSDFTIGRMEQSVYSVYVTGLRTRGEASLRGEACCPR